MYKFLNKTYKKNLEFWGIILLLCLLIIKSTTASAFTFKAEKDTVQSSSDSSTVDSRYSVLLFGTSYGNNSSYLGRYQSSKLPFLSSDITYRHKTGLWVSALAYDILNSTTFIDEIDLMAGLNIDFSKKIDGSIYYSRYFFSPESELIKASVANALNLSLGLDYNILYTKLTFSHIFGGANDFFVSMDHSRYFEIEKVLHKSDYISFDPKFSIISGTQSFVDSHFVRKSQNYSSPVKPTKGPGKPSGTITEPNTSIEETLVKRFDIMAYEISLPISYTFKNLTLEISGRYSIPVNLSESDISNPQMFLTTSLMYSIY